MKLHDPINLGSRLYPHHRDRVLALLQQIARDSYVRGIEDARANSIEVCGPSLLSLTPELKELGLASPQQQLPKQPTFTESEPE